MSRSAALAWVCAALVVASVWSGSGSGPLFWAGVIGVDVLVVSGVCVMTRWITRKLGGRAP